MNARLKEIRKTLKLSQEAFGARIGITGSGISYIESGRTALTEQNILAICREFNVNYDWLKNGEGDMFEDLPDNIIGGLASDYNLDALDRRIIIEYLKLRPEERAVLKKYVSSLFDK